VYDDGFGRSWDRLVDLGWLVLVLLVYGVNHVRLTRSFDASMMILRAGVYSKLILTTVLLLRAETKAFLVQRGGRGTSVSSLQLHGLAPTTLSSQYDRPSPGEDDSQRRTLLASAVSAIGSFTVAAIPALAATVSKNNDVSGLDFSGQDLSNKDFSKMIARNTKFQNCNLQGSSFIKADLTGADFSGSNLQGASFVDATLDGATFANAQAQRAWFSKTILDIADSENVDLTDSMWPSMYQSAACSHNSSRLSLSHSLRVLFVADFLSSV
jgi:Pentapeptide repeats (9 copies)